jgi:hypothetical protein
MSDQGDHKPGSGTAGGDARKSRPGEQLPDPGEQLPDLGEVFDQPYAGRLTFSDDPQGESWPGSSRAAGGATEGYPSAGPAGSKGTSGQFTPAADRSGPTEGQPAPAGGQALSAGGWFTAEAASAEAAPAGAAPAGAAHAQAAPGEGFQAVPDGGSFDGVEDGEGDSNYAGVDMSGPSGPVKAGVPSSGNWQMPEWMRPEAGDAPGGGFNLPEAAEKRGKGKIVLLAVVAVLVVALLAAGAVLLLKPGSGKKSAAGRSEAPRSTPQTGPPTTPGPTASTADQSQQGIPDTPLTKYPGTHTKAVGRVDDTASGLSYPRLGQPWAVPAKKSGLLRPGWSGQQVTVTERHGDITEFGQLLSGVLGKDDQALYKGPGSEHETAVSYEQVVEQRLYAFPHDSKQVASQAVDLPGQGGKGWLVGSSLSYHRAGIKATGEILIVAVVNTGKPSPAVLVMSVPNNAKKLLPDLDYVVSSLTKAH